MNSFAEPLKLSGHESNLRHCLFYGDNHIVSCSDDKTLRIWDVNSGQEVRRLDFPSIVSDIEILQDARILTMTYGSHVAFWNLDK